MAAVVSSYLTRRAESFYVGKTYQILLLNVTDGALFTAASQYADILPYEITLADGGYSRIEFTYQSTDILSYYNGIPLRKKTVRFVHDNSESTMRYTHYALVEKEDPNYYLVGIEALPSRVILTNGMVSEISVRIVLPPI